MTAIATSRTQRKNRARRTTITKMRDQIARLHAERLLLARLALPNHARGGFHNPLIAWEARVLAERILEYES